MAIPKKVIDEIKLAEPKALTRRVKIIFEEHQVRINIPAELSDAMQIRDYDEIELTFDPASKQEFNCKLIKVK